MTFLQPTAHIYSELKMGLKKSTEKCTPKNIHTYAFQNWAVKLVPINYKVLVKQDDYGIGLLQNTTSLGVRINKHSQVVFRLKINHSCLIIIVFRV